MDERTARSAVRIGLRAFSLVACCILGHWHGVVAEAKIVFGRDIRPLFSENCYYCHGADAANRQADLRLDVREAALASEAIVPGDPSASLLVERLFSDDPRERMPPPSSHRMLSDGQRELIKQWIAEGANYSDHWAFVSPQRPALPEVSDQDWPRNAIDRFVLARLEEQGLRPAPVASAETLLRRLSFELNGLPPTAEQIGRWLGRAGVLERQTSSDVPADPPYRPLQTVGVLSHHSVLYAQVLSIAIDELLASPHYGERMTVDWLDIARYADTHGYNNDARREMWRWRDWVVDAFNRNLRYDEFLTQQLAGDLLPQPSLEQQIATGFNRNHVINSEGGTIDEEYRVEYVADRVRTMSLAWLGLTLECARCHDHKFDPISQSEYYALFAFFNNIDEWGEDGRVANAAPIIAAPTADQQRRQDALLRRENELRVGLDARIADFRQSSADRAETPGSIPAAPDEAAVPPDQLLVSAGFDEPLTFPRETPLRLPAEKSAGALPDGWCWMAWIKPDATATAPLVSTMEFSLPKSAAAHGRGLEVRLTSAGEVELRSVMRWPMYSTHVVSRQHVQPGVWQHVCLLAGCSAREARIFIDGIEAETLTHHDGQHGDIHFSGNIAVGWSAEPDAAPFQGEMRRLRLARGPIQTAELEKFLDREALLAADMNSVANVASGDDFRRREARLIHSDGCFARDYERWRQTRSERLALARSFPSVMVMRERAEPRSTHILERGHYARPGRAVEADVPAALKLPFPADHPRNRLGLATWLTHPRNPLTSRVVVNRLWQSFFGVGLVKSVEDFGLQSDWPSHPELLDWLAVEFVESGWNLKHIVRLIVDSAAYRQSSAAPHELWQRDPENRLLARGPRQRLCAEMIRDQALTVAGLIDLGMGGPPVFPYQPDGLYRQLVTQGKLPGTTYTPSQGRDLHRRSVYTFWKRTIPHPTLATFDAPDRESCVGRRSVTNTPLQSLVLMNDPVFVEASRALGTRMIREGGASDAERIEWGFRLVTSRSPSAEECAALLELLANQRAEFGSGRSRTDGWLSAGEVPWASEHPRGEVAAYATVASLLLNLDEALTRN